MDIDLSKQGWERSESVLGGAKDSNPEGAVQQIIAVFLRDCELPAKSAADDAHQYRFQPPRDGRCIPAGDVPVGSDAAGRVA